MTDRHGPLDPRVDMMVSALYGELDDAEREHFDRLLREDEELRHEWEELQGTRTALAAWEMDETPPSFVVVDPAASAKSSSKVSGELFGARFWERIKEVFQDRGQLGWAVAGLATFLLLLSLANFRIDFDGSSVAFRFGPPTTQELSENAVPFVQDSLGTHIPLEYASAGGDTPYLTRAEFENYTRGISLTLTDLARTAEFNRAQTEQMAGTVRTAYQGLQERQMDSYYDLRGRIENILYGLEEIESGKGLPSEFLEQENQAPRSRGPLPQGTPGLDEGSPTDPANTGTNDWR